MKFVGLLSGGKDSCYNLVHCAHNGHELIAAATLSPPPGTDELDSYLYQTVGHDAIGLVAQALQVPLYRHVIAGTAIELSNEYGGRTRQDAARVDGDETEDLFDLLSTVKDSHPDVEGVAIGAILSNYQRVRMEHVCRRLNLVPLCYLWQRDQRELLTEMIDGGMECILIKVAGIGLTTRHLGKTLAEMKPTLWKLNDLYGSHVCGEGGEYETLTLDCPLFKKRIQIQETETVIHSDSSFGTVAFLKFKSAVLAEKRDSGISLSVTVPPLLDDIGERVCVSVGEYQPSISPENFKAHVAIPIESAASYSSPWLSVANIVASHSMTFEDEVREVFNRLLDQLSQRDLEARHIATMDVFLSSMDLFPVLNRIYAEYFATSPPARACVAVDLSPPIRIALSCIANSNCRAEDRQALHVQGLSYWAPANIGPYSQAITVGDYIFISGQIGLLPASTALPEPGNFALEAALSLQHVRRVLAAVASKGIIHGAVIWLTASDQVRHMRRAWECNFEGDYPPVVYVGAKSLPKGALVESHVLSHCGIVTAEDEDGDVMRNSAFQVIARGSQSVLLARSTISQRYKYTCIAFNVSEIPVVLKELDTSSDKAIQVRLFYSAHTGEKTATILEALSNEHAVTSIPVQFIATQTQTDWDYALTVTSVAA